MTEVFLENKSLDLSEGLSNLLTYNIDDIKDVGSRNTSFSKTIILPGTASNNQLFGFIFDVRISNQYDATQRNVGYNFNVTKQANCIIFQDHLQVFKGILRLMKIVILDGVPEYECVVFGELGGLVNSIGTKKIEELDFSVYDHVFNASNVTNSWNASGGTSFFYPLADVGGVSTNKIDYDIRAFRPALYLREYLDKILTNAGYGFECALFETLRFRSLVVQNNQKVLLSLQTDLLGGVSTAYLIPPGDNFINFQTTTGSGFTVASQHTFTYAGASSAVINIAYDVYFNSVLLSQSPEFTILKNGISIYSSIQSGSGLLRWVGTIQTSIDIGDTIEFKYLNCTDAAVISGTMSIVAAVPVQADIQPGQTVVMNDTLAKNILQKDFLSSVLKLFNLYVYDDPLKSKFVNIKPYVDFYDLNVSGITDWTYKMDRSRAIELIPMSELTARLYEFKLKPDVDYYNDLYNKKYNETYGSNLYDNDFEFSNDKKTIEIIFSPSILVGYLGVDKIVTATYKKSAGVEERTETNIRLLQTKKITGVTSWSIKDGASVLQAGLTTYGYGGHYDDPDAPANDIHFGVPMELFFTLLTGAINVTQFNVYWSSYMAEITDKDSKLLSAFFKLSNKDIFDLDFSKLLYLDGSYWRLNKVLDWNASDQDVCKVELLKAIILIY